jgi:hypothetical protein
MEQKNQLIERLSKTYVDFESALSDGEVIFSQLGEKSDGKRCPEQVDLAPILKSFQEIALTFSAFLEVLEKVLHDQDLIVSIQQMPPDKRPLKAIGAEQLLPFYWTMNNIDHKLYDNGTPRSYLWEVVHSLATEYAYYGSSMTAGTSLISQMEILTGVFDMTEGTKGREIYLEFAPKILEPEYIKGLFFMSEYAALLATAGEHELRQKEVACVWWCNMVDATPKNEAAYYTLSYFIEGCPDPRDSEIIKRLRELAESQGVHESIREQAQLKLTEAGSA